MGFLQRSNSNRIKKTAKGRGQQDEATVAERRDVFESIDEAVREHRKSMAGRPKSAGNDKRRKRSSSKPIPIVKDTKELKCSEDLQAAGQVVEYKDGLDTFRFPTPSPRMPPRSATFQHSPSPLQYGSPSIGVAIGSPSHAPPSWGRSHTVDHLSNRMRQPPPSCAPPAVPEKINATGNSPEQRKKKTSSWKTVRNLFRVSSKHVESGPSHKAKQDPGVDDVTVRCSPQLRTLQSSEAPSPVLPNPSPLPARKLHSRTPSLGQRLDGHIEGDRTSFMPSMKARMMRGPGTRGSTTPSPRPWRASEDAFKQNEGNRHDSPMSNRGAGMESIPVPRTPKLTLEFPTSSFERYSVMFEKVLSNDSRPSLLERRQSRLQRTKSRRQDEEGDSSERLEMQTSNTSIPQRSLTSPHLTVARSLSIRVDGRKSDSAAPAPAQGQSTAVNRPRPILRSNTAPPGAVSPKAAAFMRDRKATLESSPESPPASDLYSEASLPPTPTTITTCTDAESVKRVLEHAEPAWDMITSKPIRVVSPVEEQKPDAYIRVKSPEDLERQIVQISVARQVSVSRARSRVQRATATKQPLRPQLVELTKNRKSTVGILESAADYEQEPEVPSVPRKDSASETA